MIDINERVREGTTASRLACFLTVVSIALITCFMGLMPVDAAESGSTPTETINGTVTELFSILEEFQGSDRSEARRYEIERVIRRNVYYEEMARRALGASWAQMEDGARGEYVELFVHLLRDAMANRMTQYSGEQITYLSERRELTCAEVKTRLGRHGHRLSAHEPKWTLVGVRRYHGRQQPCRQLSCPVCQHHARCVIGRTGKKIRRKNTTCETF